MSIIKDNYLIDLIDSLAEPDVDDNRWRRADKIAKDLGASALNMSSISLGSEQPLWMRSSMRDGFVRDYIKLNLLKHDPFPAHFKVSNEPFLLVSEDIEARRGQTKGLLTFKRRLLDHSYGRVVGIGSAGGMLGTRRGVMFCFDLDTELTESDQWLFMSNAAMFAAVLNLYVEAPRSQDVPGLMFPRIAELTDRERDMLSYLARGLKNDRIAERTGLAEVTVRKHMAAARNKLGASTREQALAIAIKFGLINL